MLTCLPKGVVSGRGLCGRRVESEWQRRAEPVGVSSCYARGRYGLAR